MVDTSCMSLDHITTSTCFPEPATSLGHLGLLHLGDESEFWPLNAHFTPALSTFPRFSLPHHRSQAVNIASTTCASVTALSPMSQRLPASTSVYLRVPAPTSESQVLESRLPRAHTSFSHRIHRVFESHYAPPAIFTLATCRYRQKSEPQQQNSRKRHARPHPATLQQCQLWPQPHYPHHLYPLPQHHQHLLRLHLPTSPSRTTCRLSASSVSPRIRHPTRHWASSGDTRSKKENESATQKAHKWLTESTLMRF